MLKVETALVRAQAEEGIIPRESADKLIELLPHMKVDSDDLRQQLSVTGTPIVGLLNQIKSQLRQRDPEMVNLIHLGATSQDIVDTATVILIADYCDWLSSKLEELKDILVGLVRRNPRSLMVGRTLGQQASLTTFGVRAAHWLGSICRSTIRLEESRTRLNKIQMGGAVGIGNSFLSSNVRHRVAENLGLENAPAWHTQRDNLVALATELGILSGSLGKIAIDIIGLSQSEVMELAEPPGLGRGVSSAMPHKRNPVLSMVIRANSQRTPFLVATMIAGLPQEQERSAGLWQAEWEVFPQIMGLVAGSMEKSIELLGGLEVRTDIMLKNIDRSNGLVFADRVMMALSRTLGKEKAFSLVSQASDRVSNQEPLMLILEELIPELSGEELKNLFEVDPVQRDAENTIREILSQYGYTL